MRFSSILAAACVAAIVFASYFIPARSTGTPASLPQHVSPGVITTRQAHAQVAFRAVLTGHIMGVGFGSSDSSVYALTDKAFTKYAWQNNRIESVGALGSGPSLVGLTFDPATNSFFATLPAPRAQGLERTESPLQLFQLTAASAAVTKSVSDTVGQEVAGAPVLSRPAPDGTRIAVVPLTAQDRVAEVSMPSGIVVARISTGVAPFAAAIDSRGTTAYVTNWGGRFPHAGDKTGLTGVLPDETFARDPVVVDSRGIASTGTVSRIDLRTHRVIQSITVGRQPTALLWDQPRARLYVTNSNDDTISVIDTNRNMVIRTFSVETLSANNFGAAPLALALSRDGARLFVACAGLNAIAILDAASGEILGAIPTDWYPMALSVSPSGKYLAVGTYFGEGSGTLADAHFAPAMLAEQGWATTPLTARYVHAYRGSVNVFAIPSGSVLARDTQQAQINTNVRPTVASSWPMPPIRHVVYIVKENRSYDQLFGDMGKGNSDPRLVEYGKFITPNHHKLANQFVLLDNFYATGGNSGDGHQWVTQGNETPYAMLPGYEGRSYPFDGTDPIAYSKTGFIWNDFHDAGLSVQDFGEFAGVQSGAEIVIPGSDKAPPAVRMRFLRQWVQGAGFANIFHTVAPIAQLNQFLVADYPAYGGIIPDVVRARIFLRHLRQWNAANTMPNLTLVQLPSDHTAGTEPGYATPAAAMADNDYALGQIVDGVSHSRFWKSTVIFVVEDDAQGGVDHVDGHRTIALIVSPYTQRGIVDSTQYAHPSMLKTMEELFGLHPMNLFDRTANDMRRSFTARGNFAPYVAAKPNVPLLQINPPAAALRGPARAAAIASAHMNFVLPDAAPPDAVNRILWHAARGWNVPYPENGGRKKPDTDNDDD